MPRKKQASPKPSIGLRLLPATLRQLDDLADRSEVSRAAMAELLIVEGIQSKGIDAAAVSHEAREARALAVTYSKRIAAAVGDEVARILEETT